MNYYDYLLVANGHHWDPVSPQYPGEFSGEVACIRISIKKPLSLKINVFLLWVVEILPVMWLLKYPALHQQTYISMRRGYHIFPKFIFGKPTDVAVAKIQWMPSWLRQKLIGLVVRGLQGRYAKYKLMKPDCGPLEIHPTINTELLYFIRHGKIILVRG